MSVRKFGIMSEILYSVLNQHYFESFSRIKKSDRRLIRFSAALFLVRRVATVSIFPCLPQPSVRRR